MILDDRGKRYLAFLFAFMEDPNLVEASFEEQWPSVSSYARLIHSVVSFLPDDITVEQLKADHSVLLRSAEFHLYSQLRADPMLATYSDETIREAMDDLSIAEMADTILPVALQVVELAPRVEMMKDLIDYENDSVDLDSELKNLSGKF